MVSDTHYVVLAMFPSPVVGGDLFGICAGPLLSITGNEAIATSQQIIRRLPTASSGASGHRSSQFVCITTSEASILVMSIPVREAAPRILADLIDLSAADFNTSFPAKRLVMDASRQNDGIVSFGNCWSHEACCAFELQ